MKRNCNSNAGIQLQTEVKMPTLVKVDSYMRIRNGRREKVQTYYRYAWKVEVVKLWISTKK